MELLKMLSANEIVAQVISFLLLLFVLRIFAWKKILGLIDRRKETIAAEFKKIEETKSDVARLRADYESRLAAIEHEAAAKIQEAIAEGRKFNDQARIKAQDEAARILGQAQDDIKAELAKAKDELKERIVDLSLRAAESVFEERMTEDLDKKLVRDFLDKVDKS